MTKTILTKEHRHHFTMDVYPLPHSATASMHVGGYMVVVIYLGEDNDNDWRTTVHHFQSRVMKGGSYDIEDHQYEEIDDEGHDAAMWGIARRRLTDAIHAGITAGEVLDNLEREFEQYERRRAKGL